jgi:hypothetical protein
MAHRFDLLSIRQFDRMARAKIPAAAQMRRTRFR